jgi:trimeric autotransporter adhesin
MRMLFITTLITLLGSVFSACGQIAPSGRAPHRVWRDVRNWNSRVRMSPQAAESRDHLRRNATDSSSTPSYAISTIAGCDRLHDGGPALEAPLRSPAVVVAGNAGTLYVGDISDYRVRQIVAGRISTYAGVGFPGYSGDGLKASQAAISYVTGMALDAAGNLYLADWDNERVRKIDSSGVITTIAGNGDTFFVGDGGLATGTSIDPLAVTLDTKGNIYIADAFNYRIRKVTPAGVISTIAGSGVSGFAGDGGLAIACRIGLTTGVAVDAAGNVYFTDYSNNRVRKIDTSGIITTIGGNGNSKFSGDGGPATLAQLDPFNLTIAATGNLYIADQSNHRIRKITAGTGLISTVAGNGNFGLTGDGGLATAATLSDPTFVSVDASGNLYIADAGNDRIRKVTPDGKISTVAGAPVGDGGPATSAFLDFPVAVTTDKTGDLFISDADNNRVRKVVPAGTISTIAGIGRAGYDNGAGQAAAGLLDSPGGTAVDTNGNIYIADTYNYRIRKVTPGGVISTIAGTGKSNFSGDGGPATAADIGSPTSVAVDAGGNIFFTDMDFSRIRKIAPSGTITTIAGNGSSTFAGDGGAATAAQLDPFDIALDQNGNLYVADLSNNRIRKIDSAGIISTVAGSEIGGYDGDGGPATSASLSQPTGMAVDSDGNLYIADSGNWVVRRVSQSGVISTIAGTGKDFVYAGDGGQALSAQLDPIRVAVSGTTVLVADAYNDRVRKLTPQTPALLTLSGGDNQTGIAGTLFPQSLSITVADNAGIPVAGVTVTFTVTVGSATLKPTSAVTGQDGTASTQVTAGGPAGPITVTATAVGLTAKTFHLSTTAPLPPVPFQTAASWVLV